MASSDEHDFRYSSRFTNMQQQYADTSYWRENTKPQHPDDVSLRFRDNRDSASTYQFAVNYTGSQFEGKLPQSIFGSYGPANTLHHIYAVPCRSR